MLYFTSDTHFYHYKEFLNRPVLGPGMDELLIANWNSVVKPSDSIYHLGDFGYTKTLEDAQAIFSRLNGDKHLVLGNHDQNNKLTKLKWSSIHDTKMLSYENHRFFLSHYAHRTWPSKHHGTYHLFGHSHGKLPDFDRSHDVGVDAPGNNYTPLSVDQIVARLGAIEFKGIYD